MDAQPLPQSVESEQALLGGLLLDPDMLAEVEKHVEVDDFWRPDHGRLFTLLKEMVVAHDHIDPVSVGERILRGGEDHAYGGYSYVVALPDKVPSRSNLAHYARIVRDKSTLRKIARAAVTVGEQVGGGGDPAEVLEAANRAFLAIAEIEARRDWAEVSKVLDEVIRDLETQASSPDHKAGFTTGFRSLDGILTGLHPGQLLILAARPGMGKTALALNMARHVAVLEERPVGIFSLEMSRHELVGRLLAAEGLVDGRAMKTAKLTEDDWTHLDAADQSLRRAKILIDDTPGVTIDDLRVKVRRLANLHGDLGLIVIDYLQLMQGTDPRASRQQQISEISRGLKIVAKETEAPVLALSQLNRDVEKREDKRPKVSDLRESGAIEQDADVIMFIYRDEVYHPDTTTEEGKAEVIVAKHRSGPLGKIKLAFLKQYTRFNDLAESDYSV